jgi:hypothetical protein
LILKRTGLKAYLVEEDEEETMKSISISGGGGSGGGGSSSSSNVIVMTLNQIAGFLVHCFISKRKCPVVQI